MRGWNTGGGNIGDGPQIRIGGMTDAVTTVWTALFFAIVLLLPSLAVAQRQDATAGGNAGGRIPFGQLMDRLSSVYLLQTKMNSVFKQVGPTEQTLFRQCAGQSQQNNRKQKGGGERDAEKGDGVRQVARCLAQLLDARDRRGGQTGSGGREEEDILERDRATMERRGPLGHLLAWLAGLVGGQGRGREEGGQRSEKAQQKENRGEEEEEQRPRTQRLNILPIPPLGGKRRAKIGGRMMQRQKRQIARWKRRIFEKPMNFKANGENGRIKMRSWENLERIRLYQDKYEEYKENMANYEQQRRRVASFFELKERPFALQRGKGRTATGNGSGASRGQSARRERDGNGGEGGSRPSRSPFPSTASPLTSAADPLPPPPPSWAVGDAPPLALFSPKLFSVFGPAKRKGNKRIRKLGKGREEANATFDFLSPELLSLQETGEEEEAEEEGGRTAAGGRRTKANPSEKTSNSVASLPELLKHLNSDRRLRRQLLNSLLEAVGVGKALDQIVRPIEHISRVLDQQLLPLSREMVRSVTRLARLKRSLSTDQRQYFLSKGYTFLSEEQLLVMEGEEGNGSKRKKGRPPRHSSARKMAHRMAGTKFRRYAEGMEDRIEDYVRQVATNSVHRSVSRTPAETGGQGRRGAKGRPGRRRRQTIPTLPLPISGPVVGVLTPFAFVPQVNSLQLFTLYVLSPQAFIPSYWNPAVFYVQLLSPWAFLANLFSPQAFTCLCLSPVFFESNVFSSQFFILELLSPTMVQANVLSPYFFIATIGSPQILIADLLTPNFLQYKIFSEQAFIATLLSPNIGSPNIFSNQTYFLDMLSPEIAAPNVHSKLRNSIQLFSPEILGGHDEREFETEGENLIVYPPEEEPEETPYLGIQSENPNGEEHIHPNVIHPAGLG